MTQNSITSYGRGGMTFAGPEAVDVFRIATLRSALGLLAKGIRPTRGLSLTKALAMATQYTGKKYKRSQVEEARADLEQHAASKAQRIHTVNALEAQAQS